MIKEAVAFAFGSVVGSFLNVCIHRMPLGESIVWPRSRCPHCSKKIPGYDNIPFISFLLLGGKCRHCRKPISWRYPLVEFITAAFFALLMWRYGITYEFFYYLVFICGLIIATFVDIKHRIIPDEVSVGGMVTGFLLHSALGLQVSPFVWSFSPMVDSLLGIVVGGGIIYGTGALFDLVYFKLLKKGPIQGETESMGGGDVKLLAMIGAFLGWKMAVLTFFLAPFFGAVVGVVNLLVKKDHTIAYGPFLVAAALVSLWWYQPIINLVLYR